MLLPLLALALAGGAQAIGFGRPPSALTLGAALDFPLPVRLESGEAIEPGCVAAEVSYGERRLLPHQIQVRLEGGADASERVIRVYSTVAIDEPVVTVTVTAGCTAKATRRVTMFADPPLGLPAAAPQALPLAESVGGAATTSGGAGPAPVSVGPVSPPPSANLPLPDARTAESAAPRGQPTESRAQPPSPPERVRTPRAPARERATSARAKSPPVASRPVAPRTLAQARPGPSTRQAAAAPAPRLRLEAPEAALSPSAAAASAAQEALSAAMRAASAADASAVAASQRVKQLEGQLDKVLTETRRQNEQLEALRRQVGAAQREQDLLPWLGALLAVLAAGCVWLGLQVRRLKGEREAAWWAQANAGAAPDAAPGVATEGRSGPASGVPPAAPGLRAAHPPAPGLAPESIPSVANTQALPVSIAPESQPPAIGAAIGLGNVATSTVTAPIPREVSVEELIDLEQQAEFFVVLGQEESAIDLLVSHIRSTGGTSPLPYLKLLEIHRRRDEREAYERTRTRFNHRFNAYAPDWDVDMQHGRSLEDYPQVVQRLQRAWPRPMDAMALLETLLFRTDGGELFELPAYRDVLLLYGLARDLIDRQPDGSTASAVDVLLPLGESQSFEPTTPQPHLSFELPASRPQPLPAGSAGGPATDVDLDLSEPPSRDVTAPGVFQDSSYSDSDFVDLDRFGTQGSSGRRPR